MAFVGDERDGVEGMRRIVVSIGVRANASSSDEESGGRGFSIAISNDAFASAPYMSNDSLGMVIFSLSCNRRSDETDFPESFRVCALPKLGGVIVLVAYCVDGGRARGVLGSALSGDDIRRLFS